VIGQAIAIGSDRELGCRRRRIVPPIGRVFPGPAAACERRYALDEIAARA
jgi:hypothetical protein